MITYKNLSSKAIIYRIYQRETYVDIKSSEKNLRLFRADLYNVIFIEASIYLLHSINDVLIKTLIMSL